MRFDSGRRIALVAVLIACSFPTFGTYQMKGINFRPGKPVKIDTLGNSTVPGTIETLDYAVTVLKSNPNLRVDIIGHTDARERSNAAECKLLATRRALMVAQYIFAYGAPPSTIRYISGVGSDRPLLPYSIEAQTGGSEANRRVEFAAY